MSGDELFEAYQSTTDADLFQVIHNVCGMKQLLKIYKSVFMRKRRKTAIIHSFDGFCQCMCGLLLLLKFGFG